MKILGIIAEYNPFHNGHAYQIAEAKKAFGADYTVIVMSGNFVQRGSPALIDKFARARMALMGGADLVFELPVLWATASAEYFASAGIACLDKLGIIDGVSFGCETKKIELLQDAAEIFAKEPPVFRQELLESLKQGNSYPAAREHALQNYLRSSSPMPECLSSLSNDALTEKLHAVFGSPNNILALEYLKALSARKATIHPVPILRSGSSYHEETLKADLSSATAIRNMLLSDFSCTSIRANVPPGTAGILSDKDAVFLSADDFSPALYYQLWLNLSKGYEAYADCSVELSNRILNLLHSYTSYSDFCLQMKRKETTYTRISRMFLHILLNIKNADYLTAKSFDYIPYFRLLGFRKQAAGLLTHIKEKGTVPLIPKISAAPKELSADALKMLTLDISASDLYYGIQGIKSSRPQKPEYQRELVILS